MQAPRRRLSFVEEDRSGSIFTGGGNIRCPKCRWQPTRDSRWSCACGHVWNTFDTRGECPACAAQWRDTQCLHCHAWSLHDDWYG